MFYKYIFSVERTRPEILEKPLQFNENLFQEILEKFEERAEKLEETELKEYPNPFIKAIPVEEEELTPHLSQ